MSPLEYLKNDKLISRQTQRRIQMEIKLNFDCKYYGAIPESANFGGIYLVYANLLTNRDSWTLLDIGQSQNIYERHVGHERKQQWIDYAKAHNCELVYFAAKISNENMYRDIAEAALLYKWQPKCPTDGKEGYHHGNVKIVLTGFFNCTVDARNTD